MRPSLYPRCLGWKLPGLEQIRIAAQAGFPSIDLAIRDLHADGESAHDLRRALDDHGLRAGAFPLPVDWRRFDLDQYTAQLKLLPILADYARALGLTVASTWVLPGYDSPALAAARHARPNITPPRDLDTDGLLSLHLDRLEPIVPILNQHGIRLALEVIGVRTFRDSIGRPYIHHQADPRFQWLVRALNELVDSPPGEAVGVLCDTFHLHAANEPIESALAFGPRAVGWIHVADLPADFHGTRDDIQDHDRGLPGESGHVPIASMLAHLHAAGVDAPVTPEPLSACRSLAGFTPLEQAHRLRATLDSVWPAP